jgi:hypothetical protein
MEAVSKHCDQNIVSHHSFLNHIGMSLLDVKFQLMVNYCSNVAFYLLLKAEGRRVADHPVILQLVKTRTLLEKLRPLDKKLSYQLNKMLKLANAIEAGDANDDNDDDNDVVGNNDALRHRPRLEMFGDNDDSDNDDNVKKQSKKKSKNDSDDDVTSEDEEEESEDNNQQQSDNVYVPPRISAVGYEDDRKSTSKRDHQRKRAATSRMAQFVVDEFGDEPEELVS